MPPELDNILPAMPEEGRDTGPSGEAASARAVYSDGSQEDWAIHEISVQLVDHCASGSRAEGAPGLHQDCQPPPLLVLTQHVLEDLTSNLVGQLLREEHKVLEAIFPRQVSQTHTAHVATWILLDLVIKGGPVFCTLTVQ